MMACGLALHGQTVVKVKKAGTLEQLTKELTLDTCKYISIKGKLNSADIRTLRRLAGYAGDGGKTGRLQLLDLRKAKFATDSEPFMELDAQEEHLAGVVQPSHIYMYSSGPKSLSEVYMALGSGKFPTRPGTFAGGLSGYDPASIRILRRKPIYYLGHTTDYSLKVRTFPQAQEDGGVKAMESESEFSFDSGISDSLWRDLCKEKINNYKGHTLERRADGRYILKATSRKGQFSPATFYKCPQMRVVALPKDIKFAPDIYDEDNRIVYFIGPYLVRWDRMEIADGVQRKLRRQAGAWE